MPCIVLDLAGLCKVGRPRSRAPGLVAPYYATTSGSLDCTVFDWLRTGREQTVVVADQVVLHVGRDVAAAARERMEDLDNSEPPASA